jgi:hypothetical protein
MSAEHRSQRINLSAVLEIALSRPLGDADRAELHAIQGEMDALGHRTEVVLSQISREILFPRPDTAFLDPDQRRALGALKLREVLEPQPTS